METQYSFFEIIHSQLEHVFDASDIGKDLDGFIRRHPTENYGIFSDYVTGDKNRPSDSFVFTITPLGEFLPGLFELALNKKTYDLKKVKFISPEMRLLFSDKRFFSLCFSVSRNDMLRFDYVSIMENIEERILFFKSNGIHGQQIAKKLNVLLTAMKSKTFNVRLLRKIIFVASIVSFITYILGKYSVVPVKKIGWFSDQDNITTGFDGIVYTLLKIEMAKVFVNRLNYKSEPFLGINEVVRGGLWCDEILRIPDYLAGTISAFDLTSLTIIEQKKYIDILKELIAGNRYIKLIRADFGGEYVFQEIKINPLT
ncbi:MAG: hypothetical protein HGA49_13330 [Eubacteriaceae bacterium]|nr:hypothetical protein [Eubacteriaceae bacterium]